MSRPMGAIEDRYDDHELLMPDRAAELANDPYPYIRGDRFREEADNAHAEALAGRSADRAGTMGMDRRIGARAENRTSEESIYKMTTFFDEVRDASESGRRRRSSRIAQHHGYGTRDMVTT